MIGNSLIKAGANVSEVIQIIFIEWEVENGEIADKAGCKHVFLIKNIGPTVMSEEINTRLKRTWVGEIENEETLDWSD